jgi:hypothetical protein
MTRDTLVVCTIPILKILGFHLATLGCGEMESFGVRGDELMVCLDKTKK